MFLGNNGPSPSLLHPDWITALSVEEGSVSVNMHGHKAQVQQLLSDYSAGRGMQVQTPDRHSPNWDSEDSPYWLYAAALILFTATAIWLGYRFKGEQHSKD
ncbi:hypothetical protein [Paenibacillus chungangensis]|uniref:Uncharacterized protein n=1 Tax=Paenibacillus chungangensis TaxID=696535 RepID=A0ABW3HQH1_9BACL